MYLQSLQQSEVLEGSSLYNADLVVLQVTAVTDVKRKEALVDMSSEKHPRACTVLYQLLSPVDPKAPTRGRSTR